MDINLDIIYIVFIKTILVSSKVQTRYPLKCRHGVHGNDLKHFQDMLLNHLSASKTFLRGFLAFLLDLQSLH